MLGLDADWAKAIKAGGNYGEVFAKNIGEATPIGLARGLNAQWTEWWPDCTRRRSGKKSTGRAQGNLRPLLQ